MSILAKLFDQIPYIGKLRRKSREIRKREGRYPGGYFYSPVPSDEDVARQIAQQASKRSQGCSEIEFFKDDQYSLLQDYLQYYNELPFPENREEDFRYYYQQGWYEYADAIFLYCHLRATKPTRIIEVGSGFSSAIILDTVELFFSTKPEMVFIEPNPERLLELLNPDDQQSVNLIQDQVQNVSLAVFDNLRHNDLLFIDSSHVVKAGSDLYFILFEVLPRLNKGVIVHFHDIFYPFDYKPDWLEMGKHWNEAYFLHAFLAYNDEWRIRFHNSYVENCFKDYLALKMPLCTRSNGSSLYIERIKDSN